MHRYRTVYRVAKVARGADAGLWRVRNISDNGIMLLTSVAPAIGERLSIALSEKVALMGTVKWRDGERCGVAFDTPIDCAALLKGLAAERQAETYRPPRLAISTGAIAHAGGRATPVRVVNMSQHGIAFAHGGGFEAGMRVKLLFDGGTERHGIVRWSSAGKAGLALSEPFACADLESAARF